MSRPLAVFLFATVVSGLTPPGVTLAGEWGHNFEAAESESRRTGRPLLIHFHAAWCGPCRKMDASVLHTAPVQQLLNDAVGVLVDSDHRPDLRTRFNVQSLPTDIVLDPSGRQVYRGGGYKPAGRYVSSITPSVGQVMAARRPATAEQGTVIAREDAAKTHGGLALNDPVEKKPAVAPVFNIMDSPPMMRGFSPVTLTEQRQWIKGRREFAAEYRGQVYYLASAEERDKFVLRPRRYTPRLLGCDAVVLNSDDRAMLGTVEYAAFYGEELYMFASQENRTAFKADPERYVSTRVVRVEDIGTVTQ